jgi:GNAT superfamily N-acetyltransferase
MKEIVSLIEDAADWLRSRGIDQWAQPWPNRAGRDSRIEAHLHAGKTWIAWDREVAAATITADNRPDPHWPEPLQREPAVYLHRLVVDLPYRGHGLGAALIDWTGQQALRQHGARFIRVNAWTTNLGLHRYYEELGFEGFDRDIDDGYPSSMLFQRPIGPANLTATTLFRVVAVQ